MLKKIFIIILLVLATALAFLIMAVGYDSFQTHNTKAVDQKEIYVADKKIVVDIADKLDEQTLGLSYRKSMSENTGMLFIFPQPGSMGFWMKNMNFSLDFIWIDSNNKIISIAKNISPKTYPKIFYSPLPVKYVLEVNAGWSDRNGIKNGDLVIY